MSDTPKTKEALHADPRHGAPSCSALARLDACPASFWASKSIPETSDTAAERGTRIHKLIELIEEPERDAKIAALAPNEDEWRTAEMCLVQERRVLEEFFVEVGNLRQFRELRLGLTDAGVAIKVTPETKAKLIVTGQADAIFIQGDSAAIIDFKTGRGEQQHAADNAQLRGLAALVSAHFRVKRVRAAIIQPWVGPPTVAEFDEAALGAAKGWLLAVLQMAEAATPEMLHAGPHCHFCPAKAAVMPDGSVVSCPAFRDTAITVPERMTADLPSDPEMGRNAMFGKAMSLPVDELAQLYRGLKLIDWYRDAIESAMLKRVEEGGVPGYALKTSPGNREITDIEQAWGVAQGFGVSNADFIAACSVPLGKLEDAVRRASGIKSQTASRTTYNMTTKEAKDQLEAALSAANALGRKADKKSIVKVTPQLETHEDPSALTE